jgi:hypothetical protein
MMDKAALGALLMLIGILLIVNTVLDLKGDKPNATGES